MYVISHSCHCIQFFLDKLLKTVNTYYPKVKKNTLKLQTPNFGFKALPAIMIKFDFFPFDC